MQPCRSQNTYTNLLGKLRFAEKVIAGRIAFTGKVLPVKEVAQKSQGGGYNRWSDTGDQGLYAVVRWLV